MATVGLTNTFLARAGEPIPFEANIAVINGNDTDDTPLPALATRSGVALVVGWSCEGAACNIQIRDDGTARIDPLGVDGPLFDDNGYDWAFTDQLVAEANILIEEASNRLVDLALENNLIDVASDATRRALRSLPATESLYCCRMRIEHAAGNANAVRSTYKELCTALTEWGTAPSEPATALLRRLTAP
jgi:hypothetical protein